MISEYVDSRKFADDIESTVYCASDGTELKGYAYKKGRHPVYNSNIIGYITYIGFAINAINYRLTRCNTKSELEQSFGHHLRVDNYLEKLPIWVAKLFPQDYWYEKDIYYTTSDGGTAYTQDRGFLKSCLIYTCLSNQNKCLSFTGSDGRYYRNELCFDTTNGDTVASADLGKTVLDLEEQKLMDMWNKILGEAKNTSNYDSDLTYGVYQITKELNTSHKEGTGRTQKTVYDYPILNGYLVSLRNMLKDYYKSHITEKMFKYELLK